MLAAGPPITTTLGHGHFFGGGGPPEKASDAARTGGGDFVKIMASGGGLTPGSNPLELQYSGLQMRDVVREVQRGGRYVAAHAHTEAAVEIAVDAGVNSIEHATGLRRNGIGFRSELAAKIVDAGVFVVPTLHGFEIAVRNAVPASQTAVRERDPKVAAGTTNARCPDAHRAQCHYRCGNRCGRQTPYASIPYGQRFRAWQKWDLGVKEL